MANATFNVAAKSESPTRTRVKGNTFEFIVDLPEGLGGGNLGPDPMEYLLGALSGCFCFTANTIAKEIGMPLTGLKVSVSGTLDTDGLSGVNPDTPAGLSGIDVKIKADTSADAATTKKWLAIVEKRCAVYDTLVKGVKVRFKI